MHRDVSFVLYRARPARGLERATFGLARSLEEIADGRRIGYCVLRKGTVAADQPPGGAVEAGTAALLSLLWRGRGRDSDTVVAVGLWAAAALAIVAPVVRRRALLIVWEHTLMKERVERDWKVRVLMRVARRTYTTADVVVGVSAPVVDFVERTFGRGCVLIPNLVDDRAVGRTNGSSASRKEGAEWTSILSIGGLSRLKNQTLLIRALQHLPGCQLLLAGDGPEREALERLVDELSLGDRVRFLGEVDDIGEPLSSADVYVTSSLCETFGLTLVEAASAHVPVVALDVEAVNSLVPSLVPGVLLQRPFTAVGLAGLIDQVLTDPIEDHVYASADALRQELLSSDRIRGKWLSVLDGSVDQ